MSEVKRKTSRVKLLAMVLLPIILLGVVIATSGFIGLTSPFTTEAITIERITFPQENMIVVDVRNVGPIEGTISTVFVNEALWEFTALPSPQLGRFQTARVEIPYQWADDGQPYTIGILTSPSNIKVEKTADFAFLTPKANLTTVLDLARIGIIVGVIPVFLGLLWFPFLRRIGTNWMSYLLGFTVGLLVFLGAESLAEATEIAGELPQAFGGIGLVVTGTSATFLGLAAINDRAIGMRKEKDRTMLFSIAYLVSLGIGLHNLGEGLAIGGALAIGAITLGTQLILGFTIHNTTEGLAIASPIIREPARVTQLGKMGLIAGVPTIFGTWIGGFLQIDVLALLFLSIGAGAILEVVYEIARQVRSGISSFHGYTGIITGLIVMYSTALLVSA